MGTVLLRMWCGALVSLWLGLVLPAVVLANVESASDDEALQQRYSAADMVSLVKVKYIGDLVNPAMSQHGLVAVQGYVYTAELLQQWKGAQRPNFKIRVNLRDCHARLALGNEYLVFGKLGEGYDFQSFSCDDLVPRGQAVDLLSALDRLRDRQLADTPTEASQPI